MRKSASNLARTKARGGPENQSVQSGAVPPSKATAPPAKAATSGNEGGPLAGVRACFCLADAVQMLELANVFTSLSGVLLRVEDIDRATHLIFDAGSAAHYEQAAALGIKIVGPNWIKLCEQSGMHLSEQLVPAALPNASTPLPSVARSERPNFEVASGAEPPAPPSFGEPPGTRELDEEEVRAGFGAAGSVAADAEGVTREGLVGRGQDVEAEGEGECEGEEEEEEDDDDDDDDAEAKEASAELDESDAASIAAFLSRAGHPLPGKRAGLKAMQQALATYRKQQGASADAEADDEAEAADDAEGDGSPAPVRRGRGGRRESVAMTGATSASADHSAGAASRPKRGAAAAAVAAIEARGDSRGARRAAARGDASEAKGAAAASVARPKKRRSSEVFGMGGDQAEEAGDGEGGRARRSRRSAAGSEGDDNQVSDQGCNKRGTRGANKRLADEAEDDAEQAGSGSRQKQPATRGKGKARAAAPKGGRAAKSKRAAADTHCDEVDAAEAEAEAGSEIDWEERTASAPRQVSVSLSHDPALRDTVLGAIAGLGGVTFQPCQEPTIGPTVSHLIVGDEATPKRTLKFLFAMAKGVPVVRASWVLVRLPGRCHCCHLVAVALLHSQELRARG